MVKNLPVILVLFLVFAAACSSKPSDTDIKRKLLMDYVCAETATVNGLKINSTKDAESIAGFKGYQYSVSGEVEWTKGCAEFGTGIPPGFTEKFENKQVILIKSDEGWQ
jgi:hypothetical protein